jgi:GDP/UDP-N,N'-diacetylbacillosamine 2-epimerase (hydrolysing)
MKVGVLTSSRADFGIYIPLLEQLKNDKYFDLEIIAFGTHLSKTHGYTISEILESGYDVPHQIVTPLSSDTPIELSTSIAKTTEIFAQFWGNHSFDLVITLGDRYEMYAAVSASSPFNIEFAHIHGGETTLGAIDNAYRHAISLFSKHIFVSTDPYKKRAEEIVEQDVKVYNVGALSIDNLNEIDFLSKDEFHSKFNISLYQPTILSTFHPETVSFEKNETYIKELIASFETLKNTYQIVITLPNTDTMGQMIRDEIINFGKNNVDIKIIESFGMIGYLTCMKYCSFLLGNTSSGFVEASFFPKYVVNLGDRQKGRFETENIITTPVTQTSILNAVKHIESAKQLVNLNTYGKGNTATKIISILKKL